MGWKGQLAREATSWPSSVRVTTAHTSVPKRYTPLSPATRTTVLSKFTAVSASYNFCSSIAILEVSRALDADDQELSMPRRPLPKLPSRVPQESAECTSDCGPPPARLLTAGCAAPPEKDGSPESGGSSASSPRWGPLARASLKEPGGEAADESASSSWRTTIWGLTSLTAASTCPWLPVGLALATLPPPQVPAT